MSFIKDRLVGTRQAPTVIDIDQNVGGPLSVQPESTPRGQVRHVPARSRMEKIGFWVIVVAAIALLLVLMGVLLPPIFGGIATGLYTALFVGSLSLMNLSRPSGWANSLLGRRVFPVLKASEGEILRLSGVNAALTFVFAFSFHVVASVLGSFFAGIIVLGGLVAAGVFYSRARKVIIKP